jgi:hypothetical protein
VAGERMKIGDEKKFGIFLAPKMIRRWSNQRGKLVDTEETSLRIWKKKILKTLIAKEG